MGFPTTEGTPGGLEAAVAAAAGLPESSIVRSSCADAATRTSLSDLIRVGVVACLKAGGASAASTPEEREAIMVLVTRVDEVMRANNGML